MLSDMPPEVAAILCARAGSEGAGDAARVPSLALTIEQLCRDLVETGLVVLHGGSTTLPLSVLEPRQANDAAKASGNMRAVYATTDPRVALLHAVLNRRQLSERFDSYVVGHRVFGETLILKVTDNVYEFLLKNSSAVWANGFVYVLDRRGFDRTDGDPSEFLRQSEVLPHHAIPVPATVGEWLFGAETGDGRHAIISYSAAETERLGLYVEQ